MEGPTLFYAGRWLDLARNDQRGRSGNVRWSG